MSRAKLSMLAAMTALIGSGIGTGSGGRGRMGGTPMLPSERKAWKLGLCVLPSESSHADRKAKAEAKRARKAARRRAEERP